MEQHKHRMETGDICTLPKVLGGYNYNPEIKKWVKFSELYTNHNIVYPFSLNYFEEEDPFKNAPYVDIQVILYRALTPFINAYLFVMNKENYKKWLMDYL